MRKKFNVLSTDGGQKIKRDQGLKAIRGIGLNPSQAEFNQAMSQVNDMINRKFDSDDDTINFDEFQTLAALLWDEDEPEEVLNDCFKRLDKDGSGTITTSEFRDLMMNHGERLTETELQDLLKLTDENHDGRINYIGKFYYES